MSNDPNRPADNNNRPGAYDPNPAAPGPKKLVGMYDRPNRPAISPLVLTGIIILVIAAIFMSLVIFGILKF